MILEVHRISVLHGTRILTGGRLEIEYMDFYVSCNAMLVEQPRFEARYSAVIPACWCHLP